MGKTAKFKALYLYNVTEYSNSAAPLVISKLVTIQPRKKEKSSAGIGRVTAVPTDPTQWHIVSAARSLTCRDDLDSKWRLLLA